MSASAERALPRARCLAAALALALVATLGGPRAASAAALRAEVNVHGSAEEVAQLQATLRSLFPADAELLVSAVEAVDGAQVMRESFTPSAGDVVARAWIELHDGARVTIYVADVSGERILVRHLPRNDEDGELVREATARVVATALEALLSGAQIGVERAKAGEELGVPAPQAPPPPPPPPAPPVTAAPEALGLSLGAHYGVQAFSSEVPVVHGPGLIFGAHYGAQLTKPGALLVGQVWWPSRASDAVSSVRIYSGALRLLATVERSFGSSVVLSAGVGGGVDLTRVEPTAATASVPVRLASPTTLTTPALRAALGAKFRQSYGFSLYTTLALDADPSGTRYVSLNDGVTTRVLEPLALRPSLVVGVATP
jgi:hypothetical protein